MPKEYKKLFLIIFSVLIVLPIQAAAMCLLMWHVQAPVYIWVAYFVGTILSYVLMVLFRLMEND